MIARLDAVQKRLRESQPAGLHTETLTTREIEVLRQLTSALSLTQIAAELYLSLNTIKTHTMALYRKLGRVPGPKPSRLPASACRSEADRSPG